ncbi:calpain-8 isoform X2 [Camelus bactrianus]|uniref:Calpain-8 isoform X2 n=1 Tax=Camelus bactrianus TaxID=9837 RepID=A0AC58PCK9_CAMBA
MAALAARVSKQRAAAEGLGSNQKAVKYLGQDFQTLRQQCLDSGVLFKDPEFPACPSALGYQDLGPRSPQARGIVWKRPTELCPSPQFIIGGAKRTDICQGALGDCWLLAAIASLTLNEELLYRVVPRDQDFQDNYAGIFHFQVSSAAEAEAITSQKLVKSHAYSITGVEEVDSRGRPERLIRLRNPWGEVEWTGAWSDNAPEWNYIAPRQKEELYKKVEDGEFWMSFSDFLRQFSRLEICNLSPDSLSSKEVHKWNLVLFNGRWTRGCTAGGCQNYPATYWTNPQFEIRLDEVDDHQEEGAGEPCCTVLLGLMQKNRRRQKRMGQGMLSIGYAVYKREGPAAAQLGRDFFQGRQPSARSATYVNLREVSARVRLPPGPYVVVPATFEPFKDGDFCLRVFSEKKAKALEIGDVVAGNPHEPHPCEVDQEDGQFERLFEKLAGKDSEVSASELKTALNEVFSKRTDIKFDGFDINTCREMISLMDSNGMGSLGLVEFKTLWLKIQKYLEIYREMDYNHLGTIDAHEMRAALKKAGFTLNNQVQQTIATRYAGSKLGVDFDGFVACMIRLETLFKLFRLLDKDQSGIVRLSLAEWLCCALV